MQYISSDTNVWIDFVTIQKTEMPFRLPYTYIMSKDAVEDELLLFYARGMYYRRNPRKGFS